MLSIKALSQFVQMHEFWAHIVLMVGVVIEGELVLIIAGILAHLHGWPFPVAFFFGFLGAMLKTILGFGIGRGLKLKYPTSPFLGFLEKKIHFFLPYFKQKPFWSIFVSKFIYGVNHLTLIFAGFVRIRFRTYFYAELASSVIWVLGLISVGYFFSHTALNISRDFRKFTLIIFGFFVAFIALQRFLIFIYQIFEEAKIEKEEKLNKNKHE
jgi:membrane protein DedA with SNARE-associated domain